MQPSAKYNVDYTDGYGFKWTKTISALYPSLGAIDNSIAISKYDAEIMRKIYRKPDSFNPIYDNAITIGGLPGRDPDVIKYFQRSDYPTSDININTVIVNASTADGGAYAIGVNDDASNVINRASMGGYRLLRDVEYNKMLFNVRVREMSFTTHSDVIQKDLYDDPTYTDKNLKDIDDTKYYAIFYHINGKVWNGSAWVDSPINPAYICTGSDTQTIQGAGSVFNNSFTAYTAAPLGTGQNIDLLTSTSNYYWSGENFSSKMNNVRYCLGLSEDITLKGSWTDNPDAVYSVIRQWLIDNEIAPNVRINFEICRELVPVGADSVVLYTQDMSAYLDNDNNLCIWSSSIHTFFMVKGSSLNKMIAGFGLYYLTDENASLTGITPDTLHNSSAIWVGEMSADGTTTGRWIKGADIANYTGYNKAGNINNPDFDPSGGGGGGGGYEDDPWHGVSFSGVGVGGAGAFAKCYYMTSTELANLRSWMISNNVPEGFDPMQQIIGLSQVPVSLSGDDNTTVQFVNSSAVYDPGVTRVVDSGVSTQVAMGTPKRYSLGSVNITRRMQQRGEPYLDYDCQLELYLPLIGVFSLDTQAVMGRTIKAEAVLDPVSGTLAAYAWVEKEGERLPVAYGSTTIGVDLPITAQQYSVARAALKQANAQLGTSLLSSTLSLIAAATAGGKGSGTGAKTATGSTNGLAAAGIREAGADYMKASQAGNVFGDFMQWGRTIRQLSYGNNTAIAGSFGGSTAQWSYPFTPYVKIIRPRYEKPSNYKHSQGVPCVQTKTVGSCTGFIQCIGVDVSGITGATDIELQAIQSALANGVFAGGGS